MNTVINYVGDYRLKENCRHREPYWASRIRLNGIDKSVVDAAGAAEDGRNIVQLLPYGPNERALDGVVQDGDLLSYMQGPLTITWPGPMNPASIGNILKGRASHAELGYSGQGGCARQVSLWGASGPIRPYDRPLFEHACDDAISIYRVSVRVYGVDSERERKLKAEVKRWKRILQPVFFPCTTMNVDPVDFTTVDELRRIAGGLLKHTPDAGQPAFGFELNCVQWSTMVFSLANATGLHHWDSRTKGWWGWTNCQYRSIASRKQSRTSLTFICQKSVTRYWAWSTYLRSQRFSARTEYV